MNYMLCVISSGRPANVTTMRGLLGDADVTWVVPYSEKGEYVAYGAEDVLEVRSTQVSHQRQAALDLGIQNRLPVVMCDDDLKRLVLLDIATGVKTPILIPDAVAVMHAARFRTGANYIGVAPTDNAYFTKRPIHTDKFVRSALVMVHAFEAGPRYDHQFKVKEDYDFTLQHLEKYGTVARCDSLLASFQYQSNRGGCQQYRTPEVEADAVRRLIQKWPDNITPNPRRENEVLLRWRHPVVASAVA